MPSSRAKLAVAVLLATLLGIGVYLFLTEGIEALRASDPEGDTTPGYVPEFVYSPPDTVPTTADYGPVGPVALVFAVPEVRTGLTGSMENPWVAVSSRTGDYRALSAPHRPDPRADAVAVSADGTTLAWGYDEGVVLYDSVRDESRVLTDGVPAGPAVGPFSPDGRFLTLYDGALRVLEVDSGDVVATLTGVDARAARQAVWTPDGAALTYVDSGELVTHRWRDDVRSGTPALTISPGATLAWQPSGNRLAAMRNVRGVRFVEIFDVADGRLTRGFTVRPPGHAQQELLGFTRDDRVAVTALRLETATIEIAFSMSTVDTTQPTQLMQLPAGGIRRGTLEVAAEPLARGSEAFDEPRWPARDVSKLVASVIVSVFLLGLYVTRRPRKERRERRAHG